MVSTVKTKVTTVKFDDDTLKAFISYFPAQHLKADDYNAFGNAHFHAIYRHLVTSGLDAGAVDSMAEAASSLSVLAALSMPSGEFDEANLITAKTDANGSISRVYGPALFADKEGGICLRIGGNIAPATHEGDVVTVGSLSGRLRYAYVQMGDDSALRVTLPLKNADVPDVIYECAVILNDKDLNQAEIQDGLEAGEALGTYLRPLGSGGGKFIKLGDLDIGVDYTIAAVVESDYNGSTIYSLELDDGRVVSLNKDLKPMVCNMAVKSGLEAASKYFAGSKLRVLAKENKGGKWFCSAQIDTPFNFDPSALMPSKATATLPAGSKPSKATARKGKGATVTTSATDVAGDKFAKNPF